MANEAKANPAAEKPEKGPMTKDVTCEAIYEGLDNKQIVELTSEMCAKATTEASVAWYRCKLGKGLVKGYEGRGKPPIPKTTIAKREKAEAEKAAKAEKAAAEKAAKAEKAKAE